MYECGPQAVCHSEPFVILSEAKNLASGTSEILRYAQDDMQTFWECSP